MIPYIDKEKVIKEIARRIKHDEMVMDHDTQITEHLSRELNTLYELSSFIKSLEVKEVDSGHDLAINEMKNKINFHKEKAFKGHWYKWMPEKISYHNGIIEGIKQCLAILKRQ